MKMVSVSLSLIWAIALFPCLTSSQASANLTCYKSTDSYDIKVSHCRRALNSIVYDSNNRLDGVSTQVLVWYKTCAIRLAKIKNFTATRSQVEQGFEEVLRACNSTGGISLHSRLTTWVYGATPRTVYNLNLPECERKTCMFHKNDCLMAMNQLPVDSKGIFIPTIRNHATRATYGNCSVTMSTTDYSGFKAAHPEVNAGFKSLLNRCGHQPGRIYISGGTTSYNGDIKVSIQSNGTCF